VTRLLVATRSRGKQAEFRALLAALPFEIVFPGDIGLGESAEEAGLEVFGTFEANARSKARWFATRSQLTTIADDSGLEVDALDGAPGVHSKRFAGLDGSDEQVTAANNALLLARLDDIPDELRTARYRCCLVMTPPFDNGSEPSGIVAVGVAEGRIARAPRGHHGFGYDPIFVSDELRCTFGEANSDGKHQVSHRARAVAALAEVLKGGPV
jgi:XTP/dITP diphosphohydrolase